MAASRRSVAALRDVATRAPLPAGADPALTRPANGAPRAAARPLPRVAAVMYTRVSSKDQEKEGFSIPAQEKLLKAYAEERNYRIVEEFTDIETAKKAGRTNFGKMIAYLKKHKGCRVVLVEKTDRLYRNLKDWVELDAMDLEIHLVKENIVLSDESRSHEKFIHGIKVLMAKNYIDNLSEETRKGMLEKAEQGIWPGAAPMGYRNAARADGKRIVEVDPEVAPLITRLFETYAQGNISIKELGKQAEAWGLRGKKSGKPVPVATLHYTLTNLLYAGEFAWNGVVYPAAHKPLVTRELWDKVQDILGNRCTYVRREQKHEFAFSGIVRCGICADLKDQGEQRLLVGEIHRGKHVYYRCDGCIKAARASYFKEAAIHAAMVKVLKKLRLDDEVLAWIRTALLSSHEDEARFHNDAISRLHKSYEALQKRMDVAYEDRVDGRITFEQYERKASEWRAEQKRVRDEIERHEAADQSYVEEGLALLEVAGRAWQLYESRNPTERRQLLNFVVLNTTWRDQKLEVTWRQPFDLLAEAMPAPGKNEEPPDQKSGGHSRWLPGLVDRGYVEGGDAVRACRAASTGIVGAPPRERA